MLDSIIIQIMLFINTLFQVPSEKQTYISINGVDISHHNKVQWDSLRNCNIDFVYIKATEGKSYKDPKRIENYKLAKKYYHVGFYVFWRAEISGKDHYTNFKIATKGCKSDLPVVLDIEHEARNPAKIKYIINEINVFSKLYKKDFGKNPIIYTWYDVAKNIHNIDSTYKYWLNIGSRNIHNPHEKIPVNLYSDVPWIILQCGKWNFGTGFIDLNYGTLGQFGRGCY